MPGTTGTQALSAQVKPSYGKPPVGRGKGKPWSSQNKKVKKKG
jgi:hypothetical protein